MTGTEPAFHIKRYAPVLYATVIIIGVTFLLSVIKSKHQPLMSADVMSIFMGVYFLVYALPKFINLTSFANTIAVYDILAKRSRSYAYAYPFIELSFSLLYIGGVTASSTIFRSILNLLVVLFSVVNIVGIRQALRTKKDANCGCLGVTIAVPLSKVTLAENGLMLVMALGMLVMVKSMVM